MICSHNLVSKSYHFIIMMTLFRDKPLSLFIFVNIAFFPFNLLLHYEWENFNIGIEQPKTYVKSIFSWNPFQSLLSRSHPASLTLLKKCMCILDLVMIELGRRLKIHIVGIIRKFFEL